jgi:hypothetical protein
MPSRSQFELFVHDLFIYAARQNGVAVAPPAVSIFVVPEWGWASSGVAIQKVGQIPPDANWAHAFAAASYMPSRIEERLKVMEEMLAQAPGEYDKYLDSEAFVWVREPSGFSPSEADLAGLERHSRLATATIRLIQLVAIGKPGTDVLNQSDTKAVDLFKSFMKQMSPDEFARKYIND